MIYNSSKIIEIFNNAIKNYHIIDNVEQNFQNIISDEHYFEKLLYKKCWIDTVQWHLEDIIRDPNINPAKGLEIKRIIDKSNQERTDIVELIDDYFYEQFKNVNIEANHRINTESPGWAIDRLSILQLKLYHWKEEADRTDASETHRQNAKIKLQVLENQNNFLIKAIDMLFADLQNGKAVAPSFKQMKMYNDPETNPVLRAAKKN